MILCVAAIAACVSVAMARRGRTEAWSLVGLFGLVILGAFYALAHAPTRLVADRAGAEVAFGPLAFQRPWREIAAVEMTRDEHGLWVTIAGRGGDGGPPSLWPFGAALLAPDIAAPQLRDFAMRIEAWRLAAQRP